MPATPEGTANFWIRHDNPHWDTDGDRYRFPLFADGGVSIQAEKNPDGTLDVAVSGPFGKAFTFHEPCPEASPKGVMVMVSWADRCLDLHLNAKPVATHRYTDP